MFGDMGNAFFIRDLEFVLFLFFPVRKIRVYRSLPARRIGIRRIALPTLE